jgi:hypothetical protein
MNTTTYDMWVENVLQQCPIEATSKWDAPLAEKKNKEKGTTFKGAQKGYPNQRRSRNSF